MLTENIKKVTAHEGFEITDVACSVSLVAAMASAPDQFGGLVYLEPASLDHGADDRSAFWKSGCLLPLGVVFLGVTFVALVPHLTNQHVARRYRG